MKDRRSVWSDAAIQKRVGKEFVAAADEVWRLEHCPGPESELFMRSANVGHYAGDPKSLQGIYAFAPNGRFLASLNSDDPAEVTAMIEKALEEWAKVPERDRYLETDPSTVDRVERPEDAYPANGLVLRVVSRDLPGRKLPDDWRRYAWNMDNAWFRGEEARALLPERQEVGAQVEVPRALLERLARCHLVDNVRGQTSSLPAEGVEKAEMVAEVEKVEKGRVTLRLRGESRAVQESHGVEVSLLGSAEFDTTQGRFVAFELVAVGTRWGGTEFNGREDDDGSDPVGFLFTLAGDTSAEHVAPELLGDYGW